MITLITYYIWKRTGKDDEAVPLLFLFSMFDGIGMWVFLFMLFK